MKELSSWNALLKEAFILARAAGFRPARLQRAVDVHLLAATIEMVNRPDFVWKSREDNSLQGIITSPGPDGWTAIHSGQHRILAGLLCDKPVPSSQMIHLSVVDATRDWEAAPVTDFDHWS